jgi:flagellar FliL protein
MSTATAADAAAAAPKKNGKKKLLIIVGAAVLVLGLAGGGAVIYLKQKAAAEAEAAELEDAEDVPAAHKKKVEKRDPKHAPTFVPLEPFTVNLADREAERYAQVSVSLELDDPKSADAIKVYMPVIRNNILMVLSHKTAAELLEREGKTRLAREIQVETARALGIEVEPDPVAAGDGEDKPAPKKRPKAKAEPLPVAAVHFSNFIIQ